MLMLTRNIGEAIIIDGGIKITVMEVQGKQIRLGIDKPKVVEIYREEIYERLPDYAAPPYG